MRQRYIDFVPSVKQGAGESEGVERGDFEAVRGMDVKAVRAGSAGTNLAKPRRQVVDGLVRVTPARKVTRTVSQGSVKPAGAARGAMIQRRVVTRVERPEVTTTEVSSFSIAEDGELGVIEDLNAHFVKTEVAKRPLSRGHFRVKKDAAGEAKAEKVGLRAEKSVIKGRNGEGVKNGLGVKNSSVVKNDSGAKKANGAYDSGTNGTYVPPRGKFINQGKVEKRPLSKTVYRKKVVTPKEEPKGPVTIIAKPEKQNHAGLIITIILTIILGAAAGTVAFLLLPK